jgi:hypothetical protein
MRLCYFLVTLTFGVTTLFSAEVDDARPAIIKFFSAQEVDVLLKGLSCNPKPEIAHLESPPPIPGLLARIAKKRIESLTREFQSNPTVFCETPWDPFYLQMAVVRSPLATAAQKAIAQQSMDRSMNYSAQFISFILLSLLTQQESLLGSLPGAGGITHTAPGGSSPK